MKLTKIYTKTGDDGTTSLVGGIRVAKDSPRLEAYGTVDELSSHLGLLVAMLRQNTQPNGNENIDAEVVLLEQLQNELFNISTMLATDETALAERSDGYDWITTHLGNMADLRRRLPEETKKLEERIDKATSSLPALSTFILPGGSMAAAQCHVCRTVCRRAERDILPLAEKEAGQYINRLSDYLYVLARKINIIYGMEEKTWQNTCR